MGRISRRNWMIGSALVAGGTVARPGLASGKERSGKGSGKCVDTQVYVGHWPFAYRMPETAAQLAALMRERGGPEAAWVGTLEGLLHKDIAGANARLAAACREQAEGILIPWGTVNPMLPDWEEDVRRCREVFGMPGIRLHPNYHGYGLEDEAFTRLLAVAREQRLIVQVVASLGDPRAASFELPTAVVDLAPLVAELEQVPGVTLIVGGALVDADTAVIRKLAGVEGVYFDLAGLKTSEQMENCLKSVPTERLLYGTGVPLGDWEVTDGVLAGAELTPEARAVVEWETARRLVAG